MNLLKRSQHLANIENLALSRWRSLKLASKMGVQLVGMVMSVALPISQQSVGQEQLPCAEKFLKNLAIFFLTIDNPACKHQFEAVR